MTWFPLGPAFTFAPNSTPFSRLSLRNEQGAQAMVQTIAIDPTNNAQTIYVTSAPWPGGSGAFRTDNGGASWTSIVDDLAGTRPATAAPMSILLNSATPSIVYMGWSDGALYRSPNKGVAGSWTHLSSMPAGQAITQLVIDPSTASSATPTIYAGTSAGLFMSTTGGASWIDIGFDTTHAHFQNINPNDPSGSPAVDTLIVDFSTSPPNFYATLRDTGIIYSTNPQGNGWQRLNQMNIGLPVIVDTQFEYSPTPTITRLALCPLAPSRLYACFLNPNLSGGTIIGIYTTTSVATAWTQVDCPMYPGGYTQGAYAFSFVVAPNSPGDGATDVLFYGDNTIYRSIDAGQTWNQVSHIAHADIHAFAFFTPAGATIPSTYTGCDGGLAVSTGLADPTVTPTLPASDYDQGATYDATSWLFQNLDAGLNAAALFSYGSNASVPAIGYIACGDTGVAGNAGTLVWRNRCVADAYAVATSPGPSAVTVWFDAGLGNAPVGWINDDGTFNWPDLSNIFASFGGNNVWRTTHHFTLDGNGLCLSGLGSGSAPNVMHFIGRIDRSGNVTQISQNFATLAASVLVVAPMNPDLYVCAVQDANNENTAVFHTSTGSSANAATVWTQLGTATPFSATTANAISSIAIDPTNAIYVLLGQPNAMSGTPLYHVDLGGNWTAVATSGALPSGTMFGACVADPVQAGVLYASLDGAVYTVTIAGGTATWTAITDNLPGPLVYDLWIANLETPANPKVILRSAVAGRGVYERDVTANAAVPSVALYMRAHELDLSWYPTVHDGVIDVFAPPGLLYHYESADIKVDPAQGSPPYYTTDPENPLPISHVAFDMLSSDASNLPQEDLANVHVKVNNRSLTPQTVWVWAIYCAGAAGVAALNANPPSNNFAFWTQFHADGTIVPNLPANSPWASIGAPVQLSNISAAQPSVASWNWQIPAAVFGNHHCLVAFVNCANAPLSSGSYNVDEIVMTNRQVSQKNLTLLPAGQMMHKLVMIFNNPTNKPRISSWHFDLRRLPPRVQVRVALPKIVTARPIEPVLNATGGKLAAIADVEIPPFGSHAVEIELHGTDVAVGTDASFHVQQVVDGRVVGGNRVVIENGRVARLRTPAPALEGVDAPSRVRLAPWIAAHVASRQKLLGRG